MTVYWTETALGHLATIHDYIARDSPVYARRVIDRVTRGSGQIAAFPHSGRIVPELQRDDIREILEGSYRLIYRVGTERIDILALIHAARQPPWGKIT